MFALDLSKSRPVTGKASIEIDRPVEEVFAFVAENFFENYPKWAPEVIEFRPINDNRMAVGALARQTRIDQGQRTESTFEVATLVPNELMVLNGLSDPYRNCYRFEGLAEAKTRLTFAFELLELELFMRPFEKLIRTAIEEGAENSVENIKQLLTQGYLAS
ncbi:MAG: SRPBCC family protein [Gammaproteobacteria bacterium]